MISRSEESEHPDKSLIAQAFSRMSLSDLGVFVFARQTVVAGVSGSSSSLGNVYGKHDWYERAAFASSAEIKN